MVQIYSIEGGGLVKYNRVPIKKEQIIEEFVEKNSRILGEDLFIIGRQVRTQEGGIIDLMGLDKDGNVAIIEMKKDSHSRKTVAQILEYAVWAEGLQYDDLNQIARVRHLDGSADLYKKFEARFKKVPEIFNQNQTLYIVAPEIGEKTFYTCMYLSTRGIQIRCVELNMYENDEQKIAIVDTVVGDESEDYMQSRGSPEHSSWEESMASASEENRTNITQIIKEIEQTGLIGARYGRFYKFVTKEGTDGTKVAIVTCNKNTANVVIRIDPDTFDIEDARIRHRRGWFFRPEIVIRVVPENFGLILDCIRDHGIGVAKDTDSRAANMAVKTRKEQA